MSPTCLAVGREEEESSNAVSNTSYQQEVKDLLWFLTGKEREGLDI